MKKIFLTLFLVIATVALCQAVSFRISFPNGGEELRPNQSVKVTWVLMGYPTAVYAKLALYRGGTSQANFIGYINQHVHMTYEKVYDWQVGKYEGGQAAVGTGYYLRFISLDGASDFSDFSDGPFSIVLPKIHVGKVLTWMELNPVPGCPMCGNFDLNDLLARLGNPVNFEGNLVLLRNGRQVGLFGKLGQGGVLSNRVPRLQFTAGDFAVLGQENQGFEVAIIGARGIILQRKAISLKMK